MHKLANHPFMKRKQSRYAFLGFIFGSLFPGLALAYEIFFNNMLINFEQFVEMQLSSPLHWIIDLAPFVLSIGFSRIGEREDRYDDLVSQMQQKIDESTKEILSEKLFFETLVSSSPLAIVIVDEREEILSINTAFEALYQYSKDEVIGKKLDPLITDTATNSDALQLTDAVLKGEQIHETVVRRRKDGSPVNVDVHAVQVLFQGTKIGALAIYSDMTERIYIEQRLEKLLNETEILARNDSLTGLYNRRAITELADSECSRAERGYFPISFMIIDIDDFKHINDTFGHQIGDRAIRFVADTINKNKRIYDQLGRWGGDEFLLILPNTSIEAAKLIGKRICELLSRNAMQLENGTSQKLTISIGVSGTSNTENGHLNSQRKELFSIADKSLYIAKDRGKNQVISST